MPRALLVSFRDPHDPMASHERRCFAERATLALDEVDVHPMQDGVPDTGALRRYDAVFFGGSGAYSVLDEVPWIHQGMDVALRVAEMGIPGFASCFGFQGVALKLGGQVVNDEARTELGATPLTLTDAGAADPLFSVLPREFLAQEGHHDHVIALPKGVTLLATGAVSPFQALRIDGTSFWASQFHPELTRHTTVDRFKHYMSLYSPDPVSAAKTLAMLESREDSAELLQILTRLVRKKF